MADTVFLSDLYAIPERVAEREDLTGSSWCSLSEDAHAQDDSFDADDEQEDDPALEPSGEVCHSFVFRGAQHDTIRTIIRADPALALAAPRPSFHSYDESSDSEGNSLSGDPDDLWADSGAETPTLTDSESYPPSPVVSPLAAAHSVAARIAARQHLEEDLDFREHEWLLQQIGCGRVEIWVSEERLQRTDAIVAEEHRPRVFFAPTPTRRPSSGDSPSA